MNTTTKIDTSQALVRLEAAKVAAENKFPTEFWIQCVRDASGRWLKYEGHSSRYGVKYFRGHQPMVDYDKPEEVAYLKSSIAARQIFYETLPTVGDMDVHGFTRWLEDLRRTLQYRPVDEWLHQRFATTAHTIVVREEVNGIARAYGDPYADHTSAGPVFAGFSKEVLPRDEIVDGLVEHHYPTLEFSELYLGEALRQIKALMAGRLDMKSYVYGVAYFYQLLINLHYFAAMNASLYMNIANGLLEIRGIQGIENGIIDFVALRLQPQNFQKYFYDEVFGSSSRLLI